MWNLTMLILLLYVLHQTVLAHDVDGENVSHPEAAVLPYSLKAAAGKDNSERYSLLTLNPSHSQADEQKDIQPNSLNMLRNRLTDDPWERISLHYKNQLTQVNHPPIDEFGYYSPHSALAHIAPANINHFLAGTLTAPLPLALMLILNVGMLLYLFGGVMSTISAATGGFNFGLPYHMYLRRDDTSNKYK